MDNLRSEIEVEVLYCVTISALAVYDTDSTLLQPMALSQYHTCSISL